MNSYIFSFKALFVALAVIASVEMGYASIHPASPAERSSYLNLNFNSVDTFHKLLIQEKLTNALRNQPDVIQIGDSSGFHGIVPSIVDQHLGGLRYENLSCCANTGYDGYYSIAQFMLRNDPSIKAIVLYFSLTNPPRTLLGNEAAIVGGEDRLRTAFGSLAFFTTLPTLAARSRLIRWVYTFGRTYWQYGLQSPADLWPELMQSIRETRGWRPEQDTHRVPEKEPPAVTVLCSRSGAASTTEYFPENYTRDILGIRRPQIEVELRRLADLAARHRATLIILAQPFPCRAIEGSYLPFLRASIGAVMVDYPNVVVPDPNLFEGWPGHWFTSGSHLRTGYEDAVSRRAGRLIAKAMGIPATEPPAPVEKLPKLVLSSVNRPLLDWKALGLTLTPEPQGSGTLAVERADFGPHLLETTLSSLPAGTYSASLTFKVAADRLMFLQFMPLQWPGDQGHILCNPAVGEVMRSLTVLDASIEKLPANTFKCAGTFRIVKPGTIVRIGLAQNASTAPYQGDDDKSISIYKFELLSLADAR